MPSHRRTRRATRHHRRSRRRMLSRSRDAATCWDVAGFGRVRDPKTGRSARLGSPASVTIIESLIKHCSPKAESKKRIEFMQKRNPDSAFGRKLHALLQKHF